MPGQGRLLGAAALLVVGSWLPWFYGPAGPVGFTNGPGLWILYTGLVALTGGLVPMRRLAAAQGALCALVALALPAWQVVRLLGLVGTQGWTPGPGMVTTLGGGALCALAARQLYAGRRGAR